MRVEIKIFLLIFCCLLISSKAQQIDEEFKLPNTTKPESYLVILNTNIPTDTNKFTGLVLIKIKVLKTTRDIFLHSRSHTIKTLTLNSIETPFERETDDVIKITSGNNLLEGLSYDLVIDFQGEYQLSSEGFFISTFVENVDGPDLYKRQAVTHFQPFSARYAFPCYDTAQEEHRSKFLVQLEHNLGYSAVSNMELFDRSRFGNLLTSYFGETPRLSPSSLAFFVSGFSEIASDINSNIKHLVAVRESEVDNTEKLSEISTIVVESVESFLGVSLSHKVLHSILLPGYERELGSFYKLNFYREDLILFNPLVSPLFKELTLFKLITNGIVSQFIGNIVTFESWSDAWIFKGITNFLAYEINSNDELFISEVLHPTLQLQSFASEFPFSADDALSDEVTKKAACTFRMIYHAISREKFTQTLQRLIQEKSFESITPDTFYTFLEESTKGTIDLRAVIEGFISQQHFSVVFARNVSNQLRVIRKPIAMPYNFLTSSMDNVASDVMWLANDVYEDVIYPSLDSDDWFLLNVDQFAFYRVNYDDDNWRAIITALQKNPQVFSTKTKAQLIDDALNLAKDGYLSYDIAFDLLEELKEETSSLPWNAAFKNLLSLNHFVVESEVHLEFQNYVLELSSEYMQYIEFYDDLPDEKATDKLSRLQMIDFVCRMKSEVCLDQMRSKLTWYVDDKEKLPVNLESSVLCFGLMASSLASEGHRLFETLWNEMQASVNLEYRVRVIDSLGCYGDVKVLFDLLETLLGSRSEVRYLPGEKLKVIQSVYSNSVEGVEATMDFMIEFEDYAVSEQTGVSNLIEILVKNLSKRIYNERLLAKFNEMLVALDVSSELSSPALQVIQNNIAWQTSEEAVAINRRFNPNNESTTLSEQTSVSTEETTTIENETESSTTDTTTLTAANIVLSTALGLSCLIIRLML